MSTTLENDILSEEKSKGKRCKQRVNIFFIVDFPVFVVAVVVAFSTSDQSQENISSFVYWFCFVLQSMWGGEEENSDCLRNQWVNNRGNLERRVPAFDRINRRREIEESLVVCVWIFFSHLRIGAKCWHASCQATLFGIINQSLREQDERERACGLTSHWTLLNDLESNCRWMRINETRTHH